MGQRASSPGRLTSSGERKTGGPDRVSYSGDWDPSPAAGEGERCGEGEGETSRGPAPQHPAAQEVAGRERGGVTDWWSEVGERNGST